MCKGPGNFSWIRQTDLHRTRICKRLRNPGIDSARLGIDAGAPFKVYKYRLWIWYKYCQPEQRFFAVLYRTQDCTLYLI